MIPNIVAPRVQDKMVKTDFRIQENRNIETAQKTNDWLKENISTIFFFATVAFSIIMAPGLFMWFAPIELVEAGIASGIVLLALSNLFGSKKISEKTQDKINYLWGALNIITSLINPWRGAIQSLELMGINLATMAYRKIWPMKA
jgi:hypothetical protein